MSSAHAGDLNFPAADPSLWLLDPAVVFLNHGSFGSCPRAVLDYQNAMRERMERQPVQFLVRELEPLLDAARHELAHFVGAPDDCLAFVPNATAGVNTILTSIALGPEDELLVSDQEYNACRNALNTTAERTRARVVVAELPFPLNHEDEIVSRLLEKATTRTKLVLVDHVTSQTGLVFPIQRIVQEFQARGVDVLVDGAHAPGMVPLELEKLGVTYYTGNCHKWICAPKGAAFLFVRREQQARVRPLVISHGANSTRRDRSRFLIEFDWTGTWDPSSYLSVPQAIRYMGGLLPGGWPQIMRRNRALALEARRLLGEALGATPPAPESMIGSLAAVPLPELPPGSAGPVSPLYSDPLQQALLDRFQIEVPVIPWPSAERRVLRISAQLYNSRPQYQRLAEALRRS